MMKQQNEEPESSTILYQKLKIIERIDSMKAFDESRIPFSNWNGYLSEQLFICFDS
jgi:hypothetical protein